MNLEAIFTIINRPVRKLNHDLCDTDAVLYQQGAGRYVGSW